MTNQLTKKTQKLYLYRSTYNVQTKSVQELSLGMLVSGVQPASPPPAARDRGLDSARRVLFPFNT
jgi:hypothetical protein